MLIIKLNDNISKIPPYQMLVLKKIYDLKYLKQMDLIFFEN